MLELRQLQALCAIAEFGSAAAAARSLGWSQPTITHHLNALGRATGTPVVQTSSRGTSLTLAGRLWLPHAQAINYRARTALDDVVNSLGSARRTVRFGVFPTAAPRLLPALISAFDAAGLTAHVFEAELADLQRRLQNLELDAAVVYTSPEEAAVAPPIPGYLPLFTEKFSLILPSAHPFARSERVQLSDLRDEVWVVGERDDDPVEQAFHEAMRRSGFAPTTGPRSDDYSVVIEYVAAGLGIAIVPELALPVGRTDVRARDVHGLELSRQILLATAPTLDERTAAVILAALHHP